MATAINISEITADIKISTKTLAISPSMGFTCLYA